MAGLDKPKILVVCGPTASGKTEFALEISRRFNGEMVCADSMQIYKGLTIGTAALLPEQAQGIPQHLVGFLSPEKRFSVAEYVQLADKTIKDLTNRGALPVVCGGTGLYIQSLVEGTIFSPQPASKTLREELEKDWDTLGGEAMLQRLSQADPARAGQLHPNDHSRILRALEAYTLTGQTAAQRDAASHPEEAPYHALCIGLNPASREELYRRINVRVEDMMRQGLLEEARQVYIHRDTYATAAQAIGYKEFFAYFEGVASLEECIEQLKQATRNYAKRQLTWFRRMSGIHWLDISSPGLYEDTAKIIQSFFATGR